MKRSILTQMDYNKVETDGTPTSRFKHKFMPYLTADWMMIMSIKIITDSTCDIARELTNQMGIDVVPLKVIFGDKQYADGIDLKDAEFFKMLGEAKTLPTTSQVSPDEFLTVFKPYADAGDDIVCICLAGLISGTYQSAVIAKDLLGYDKIHVVDTTQATFGVALLIHEAVRMRDAGASAIEIFDRMEALKSKIVFLGVVDTLKYLKMGGRLSSTAAMLGGLMNIKPIIQLKDGVISSIGKARGQSAAFDFIEQFLKKNPPNLEFPLSLAHSHSEEFLEKFIAFLGEKGYDTDSALKGSIGPVIGTHAGPGCVGIAYIAK